MCRTVTQCALFLMLLAVLAGLPANVSSAPASSTLQEQDDCQFIDDTPSEPVLSLRDQDGELIPIQDLAYRIVDYLNAGGALDNLQNTITDSIEQHNADLGILWYVDVQTADLTGDSVKDVIVDITAALQDRDDGFIDGAIMAFLCSEGTYDDYPVANVVGHRGAPEHRSGLRTVRDVNDNGKADIVMTAIDVMGTRGNFTRSFRIYEWDGDGFSLLTPSNETDIPSPVSVQNGDGRLQVNPDGTYDLILTEAGIDRHNPIDVTPLVRPKSDVWAWNGSVFAHTCTYSVEAPTFRIQAVQDGDHAFSCGDYNEAIINYLLAVTPEPLLGWNSEFNTCLECRFDYDQYPPDRLEVWYLLGYGGYRQVVSYAAQDQPEKAARVLERMEQTFHAGRAGIYYLNLARAFWQTYSSTEDLADACQSARDNAAQFSEELFVQPDIYAFLFGRGYFERYLEYPEDICPF